MPHRRPTCPNRDRHANGDPLDSGMSVLDQAWQSPIVVNQACLSLMGHVFFLWVFDEACRGLQCVSDQACRSPMGL